MGGWFPPSLRAGFIAIFRTQPTGDLPVSLLLHGLLLPYCKFLFLGAKKKTRTEVAFLSCLADADAFCFKHRRPVPGVQGCVYSAATFPRVDVLGSGVCEGAGVYPMFWPQCAMCV